MDSYSFLKDGQEEPKVSVIVVTYNSADFIGDLIQSLAQQTYKNFEVIFVDNNSSDNTVQKIWKVINNLKLSNVKVYRNDYNIGYGKAVNQVVKAVNDSKYLLIMNPDGFLSKDALEEMVKTFEKDVDNIGIIQPKILYTNGRINTYGNLFDRFGFIYLLKEGERENEVNINATDFFYASGACFLIPTRLFRKVGGFDPDFFLYADDLDLSWRVRLYGKKIVLASKAKYYHIGSASLGQVKISLLKYYYTLRNTMVSLIKNYSLKYLLLRFPAFLFSHLIACVFLEKTQGKYYLYSYFNSLFYLFRNLKRLLCKRKLVQKNIRSVPDSEIDKYITKYFLPLLWLKTKEINACA